MLRMWGGDTAGAVAQSLASTGNLPLLAAILAPAAGIDVWCVEMCCAAK